MKKPNITSLIQIAVSILLALLLAQGVSRGYFTVGSYGHRLGGDAAFYSTSPIFWVISTFLFFAALFMILSALKNWSRDK